MIMKNTILVLASLVAVSAAFSVPLSQRLGVGVGVGVGTTSSSASSSASVTVASVNIKYNTNSALFAAAANGDSTKNTPKKVIVLGGDGFCGWPTCLYLSDMGHDVVMVDNLSRRNIDVELGCDSLTPISSPQVRTFVCDTVILCVYDTVDAVDAVDTVDPFHSYPTILL
jgi:hypothetical protein